MNNVRFVVVDFTSFAESVAIALDALGAREVLAKQSAVLIKPNLINSSPSPVTTPVACCEAIVEYVRACSKADVVIGEGCGDPSLETRDVFDALGYTELSSRLDVPLIDLNTAPLRTLANPDCSTFPEMHLPDHVFTHYLVSVPVLKAHSLADVTGTLKNMMGIAPPEHYSGVRGFWKKAVFHRKMQQSIIELNRYRTPDLTLMDASVGLAEYHLGGAHCDPPIGKLLAGYDPIEVDRRGAALLGMDWHDIGHLKNLRTVGCSGMATD